MQRHTRTWKQILFCNFSVTLFRNSLDEGLKGSSASSTFSGLKRSCFNSDKLPGGPIETSAFSQALQVSAYVFMSSYCEEDVSVCPTLSNSDLIVLSSVNKNVLCSLKQKTSLRHWNIQCCLSWVHPKVPLSHDSDCFPFQIKKS